MERTDEEVLELENIGLVRATQHYIFRKHPSRRMAPFTDVWMLRLHKEIFGKAWPHAAGRIRLSPPDFGSIPTPKV